MKKIIVTGGLGFIGILIDLLLEKKYSVINIDKVAIHQIFIIQKIIF